MHDYCYPDAITNFKSESVENMRVLEFFSGIGGWRCALDKHPEHNFEIVQSFDINTVSNQVYEHNFHTKPSPKCINSLTKKMLDKHRAEMWCMSPPCQPYTRNNTSAKRDTHDQRSNAFLHLVLLLREVNYPPRYILLEVRYTSRLQIDTMIE
jgi:tRNA (cytosine38-C5)-methyltransferase